MGLDAYLYVTKAEGLGRDSDDFEVTLKRTKQIGYWRKDYQLHDYMHNLHPVKMKANDYNCVKTYLDKEQLLQLMNMFPDYQHTFGDALEYLEHGCHVYYDSWW